jgi:hypothetical protein
MLLTRYLKPVISCTQRLNKVFQNQKSALILRLFIFPNCTFSKVSPCVSTTIFRIFSIVSVVPFNPRTSAPSSHQPFRCLECCLVYRTLVAMIFHQGELRYIHLGIDRREHYTHWIQKPSVM